MGRTGSFSIAFHTAPRWFVSLRALAFLDQIPPLGTTLKKWERSDIVSIVIILPSDSKNEPLRESVGTWRPTQEVRRNNPFDTSGVPPEDRDLVTYPSTRRARHTILITDYPRPTDNPSYLHYKLCNITGIGTTIQRNLTIKTGPQPYLLYKRVVHIPHVESSIWGRRENCFPG